MKKRRVLVTFKIMIDYLLKNKTKWPKNIIFDFIRIPQALNSSELAKKIKGYDGLICGDDEVDKKVIQNSDKLKIISKWGTGIDSINKILCKNKNIKVCNTPNAFTDSVAQLGLSYILAFSKNIFEIHKKIQNENKWPKISSKLMTNQTVGIIGFGKIGKNLANLCQKLKFRVIFNDIDKEITSKKFKFVTLDNLVSNSDYVCICCDLNKTSYHLLNSTKLKKLKKTAALINIARGPIINEKSLINFLRKNRDFKVALDVFEKEPLAKNNQLKKFNNVLLSSHNAFNSSELVEKVNINTLKNVYKNLN